MFSTQNPNVVYSGGEDYCLIKWKVDSQPDKTPPEECKQFIKCLICFYFKVILENFKGAMLINKKKSKSIKRNQAKKEVEKNESELQKKEALNDSIQQIEMEEEETISTEVSLMEVDDSSTKIASNSGKASIKKVIKSSAQKEIKSMFLLSSHGGKSPKLKLFDCLYLFETLYEKQPIILDYITQHIKNTSFKELKFDFDLCKFDFGKDKMNLNLFGNRLSTLEMLSLEQAELKRLNFDKWWIFEIWKGNVIKVINELKQENNLNDTLISLHQISFGLNDASKRLLYEYIDQLSRTNLDQINKAVLFALTLFDVKKAIDIYLANNLFQYALCIAQLRLPPKHPLFFAVLNKYAIYATNTGDYETAIMCYIRAGDFENAFKVLIRRNWKNDAEIESIIKNLLKKFASFIPELEMNTELQ